MKIKIFPFNSVVVLNEVINLIKKLRLKYFFNSVVI